MTVNTPERSLTQRMDALGKANEVRSERAKIKREVKAGRRSVHKTQPDPRENSEAMQLWDPPRAGPKSCGRQGTNMRVTSPASDSTARCFMTAGSDIENGAARSLTEASSVSLKRASSARRVGSASAAKVRWSVAGE